MAGINRKENSMNNKSILFMYLRSFKKRKYDESEDEMFLFFSMMSFFIFITTIYSKS